MKKLLFIQVMWTPYNHARFSAIASECPGWDLHVFYQSTGSPYRRWRPEEKEDRYRRVFLKHVRIPLRREQAFSLNINYDILRELKACDPDRVIVSGWDSPSTPAALAYCKRHGKEIILYSDSTVHEKSFRRTMFKPYVRTLIRFFDGFLSGGTAATEYLRDLGASGNIEPFYNTVDVDHFMRHGLLSEADRKKERIRLGLDPASGVLIFSGRLVSIKKVDMLIGAFRTLQREKENVNLLIAGYGPGEAGLRNLARGNAGIRFLGHRDVDEIPRLYGISDVLVLPSIEEPWGLVVNEAMACGCAVVVSDRCGSSRDLVSGNGLVFEGGNPDALRGALRSVFESRRRLDEMRGKSLEIIRRFRPRDLVRTISYFR
jgi:glycosyltransferase involved in cell wall biosynthesis